MLTASPHNSEWLTRKKLIDARLKKAGWRIVPFDAKAPLAKLDRFAIEECPTDNGPADYALCVNGQILGNRGSQEAHARSAERPEPIRAILEGAYRSRTELPRLPSTLSLLHQRRGHLAP